MSVADDVSRMAMSSHRSSFGGEFGSHLCVRVGVRELAVGEAVVGMSDWPIMCQETGTALT